MGATSKPLNGGVTDGMKVYLESVLNCPPERVWAEVQRSSLLLEVAHPLARIEPVDAADLPEHWVEGATIRCRSYLFGIIPLGTRVIYLERIDRATREIQSRESDPLIRRWDHLIRVQAARQGWTLYSDEIEIDAGWLTFLVWLFAQWFYHHRQRKWHFVARRLMEGKRDITDIDRL